MDEENFKDKKTSNKDLEDVKQKENDWMDYQHSIGKLGTLITVDLTTDSTSINNSLSRLEELKNISDKLKGIELESDKNNNANLPKDSTIMQRLK